MMTIADFRIEPARKNVYSSKAQCFIPDDLFDDFCTRYPEFAKRFEVRPTAAQRFHNNFTVDPNRPYDCLDIKAPYDGEAVRTILAALADAGFTPGQAYLANHKPEFFCMYLRREYSPEDLEAFEFFHFRPDKDFGRFFNRASNGQLNVWSNELQDDALIGCNDDFILVKDPLYQEMRKIDWKGLLYSPAIACKDGEEEPDPRYRGPAIWELTSDVTLPATTSKLEDGRGNPCSGDPAKPCFINEGMYTPIEPHYRRSDMDRMPPFDFAHTAADGS